MSVNRSTGTIDASTHSVSRAIVQWGALALAGIAMILAAGYLGYSKQIEAAPSRGAPEGAPVATLPGRPLRPAAPTAMIEETADQGRPSRPRPAAQDAQPPLTWPFWEFRLRQPIPPRTPPLTPPPWRMIGATQAAGTWSIVILRQGRAEPEYFKVGDALPGNYRVEAITEEDVTLSKGGEAVVLSYIGSR